MTDKFHVVHLSDIQRSGSIQENDKDTLKSVRKLLIKKENDIARADRIRKMQIRDINQHYQFELGRVEAQFKDDVEECTSKLRSTIHRGQKREHSEIALVTVNQSNTVRAIPSVTSNLTRYSTTSDTTALQLGVESISEDISEATKNFRSLNNLFLRSSPQAVSVAVISDSGTVIIGLETFRVGDMVKSFSNLSQESFHGVISSISDVTVKILSGNFAQFSFLINHLREGRVVLSRDDEGIQNLEILDKYKPEWLK